MITILSKLCVPCVQCKKGMNFFMNTELKLQIKAEVQRIIDEITYEQYQFNRLFHSDVEFQKSYIKFNTIYEKYGKEAYLKYVPLRYKKQELKNYILEKNFLNIYERYGESTLHNLEYTANITTKELRTKNRFKLFFIKLGKLFSGHFISLPTSTILALPEHIDDYSSILK